MAYEIFDDVAFFYMMTSIVAIFVVPWSCYKMFDAVWTVVFPPQDIMTGHPQGCTCSKCRRPNKRPTTVALLKQALTPQLSWPNAFYFALLVLFIYLLIFVLPQYESTPLTSFDPYAILELDPAQSSAAAIKAAYRRQSLRFHPDKNIDNELAADMFIKVSKAYETLTSPEAMENIEKFGHPDGYQGVSVTIGLPSILTRRENEGRVLMLYFLLFIVIPPVCVFIWWRSAKDYSEVGIKNRTLRDFFMLIQPNYGPKYLIEILSLAAEYDVPRTVTNRAQYAADYDILHKLIKPSMVKQKFEDKNGKKFGGKLDYVLRGSILFHAYLQRIEIPESLTNDLNLLLKWAHPLLNAMLQCSIQRQQMPQRPINTVRPTLAIIDLMQVITQALWVHWSPLLQLPHMNELVLRRLKSKNIKTIPQLMKLDKDKREKYVPELTELQWKEIDVVCALIPSININIEWGVDDEEIVYEGDIVKVKVDVERIIGATERADNYNTVSVDDEDEDTFDDVKSAPQKPPSKEKDVPQLESKAADDDIDETTSLKLKRRDVKKTIDDGLNEEEVLDAVPIPSSAQAGNNLSDSAAPVVHCHPNAFPYEKREKWWILIIEMEPNDKRKPLRVVAFNRLPVIIDRTTAELHFPAPPVSAKNLMEREYTVQCMCDSYAGVDVAQRFTMRIHKSKKPAEKPERDVDAENEEEDESNGATGGLAGSLNTIKSWFDSPDAPVYWYYLYFSSIWELLLNMFVLALLLVFIFNFLVSRGYWQTYFQPTVDIVGTALKPTADILAPYVSPLVTPIMGVATAVYVWVGDRLTAEPAPVRRFKRGARGRVDRIPDDADGFVAETADEQPVGMGEEDTTVTE